MPPVDPRTGPARHGRRVRALVAGSAVLIAGTALLAACTPTPAKPTPHAAVSMPAATVPAGPSCAAAPALVVSALLGIDVGTPTENDNDKITVCAYPSGGNQTAVVVQFRSGVSADGFGAERSALIAIGQQIKDVKGLADEAYTTSRTVTGVTMTTVAARKGGTEILVTSPAALDHERTLVERLFSGS